MHVGPARSRGFAKRGAYLVVLAKDDRLLFEGCLELRVLAGLVDVHGCTLTPSHPPLPLFSPSTSPRLPITPLDPHSIHDSRLRPLVEALRRPGVRFVSEGERADPVNVHLDLEEEDVDWVNSLSVATIACVLVVWNLDSPLLTCLKSIPHSVLPKDLSPTGQAMSRTFKLVEDRQPSTGLLSIPEVHKNMLTDIVDYRGAVVLVCGDVNTGKSTFCRFLINSFLNRFERVGFLECDVGQTEFTVSMVTALHLVTRPVYGPSYTDQRRPYKAFFYGHPSPADKPRYYVRLIQQLHTVFMNELHDNGEVPLVINTCGWTTDMGVAILMDIIRLTSPSHLVRMVPDTQHRSYQPLTDLLPFTPHTLTATPGILTSPTPLPPSVQEEWCSTYTPSLVRRDQRLTGQLQSIPDHIGTTPDYISTTLDCSGTTSDRNDPIPKQTETKLGHRSTTVVQEGTLMGDELMCDSKEGSCEPEQDVEKIASQPSPPHITSSLPTHTPSHPHSMSLRMRGRRTDRLRKRERRKGSSNHVLRTRLKSKSKMKLKLVLRKYSSKVRRRGSLCNLFRIPGHLPGPCSPTVDMTTGVLEDVDQWSEVERCMLEKWVKVLDYNVTILRAAAGVARNGKKTNSSLMRRLALMAHFSPLVSGCGDHTHFLSGAPVVQVSWSDIAIHVLHRQVPRTDMMYAMRGNYIALCSVDPNEVAPANQVVEEELEEGGRVRFLCSHTPIITFLSMGMLLGCSPEKQLYYVTTPLISDPVAMDTVNVLVMGKVESMVGSTEATPTTFRHIPTGQFAWKQ